jgi:hypothetical protein
MSNTDADTLAELEERVTKLECEPLTLRDHFAMAALAGFVSHGLASPQAAAEFGSTPYALLAEHAYKVADEMLKAHSLAATACDLRREEQPK